jgi:hypothetical protein
MDARAAKGIAANIRAIVQATTRLEVQTLSEYDAAIQHRIIAKAEDRIAEWLQQPMTLEGSEGIREYRKILRGR